MICCIDPGLRGLGIASFAPQGTLSSAAYVKSPATSGRGYAAHVALAQAAWNWWIGPAPELVIIEHPRVYPGMSEKDPNDLLDVAAVGSACAALFGGVVQTVMPSEWKGNVQKDVMTERIRSKLTPYEIARVEGPKHLIHNALDAAGIGLWHFKRLNQKVYPGATR